MLNGIKDGQRITFGYVTAASIDYPKTKIRNPQTKRMNTVNDFATFGRNMGFDEGKVPTGVVKLKVYNLNLPKGEKLDSRYNEFATLRDNLKRKYGLPVKDGPYDRENINYGKGNIRQYNGKNNELRNHTYLDINMSNIKSLSTNYYVAFEDGSLIPIEKARLPIAYKAPAKSAADTLVAAGATEEEVASLRSMDYRTFLTSKILYVSCTSDNEKKLFVNTKLPDKINDLTNVRPDALVNVAKERYNVQESIQRNNMRNKIRINEATFKRIIAESVKKVLREAGDIVYKGNERQPKTLTNNTYRGVPNSLFIWHGEWSDPEIYYDGEYLNANDFEEYLWGEYKAECESCGESPNEQAFDNLSPNFVKYYLDEYLSNA